MALDVRTELLAGLERGSVGIRRRARRQRSATRLAAYVGVIFTSIVMIIPFYYMLVLSLQERRGSRILDWPPPFTPEWPVPFDNFIFAFTVTDYLPFGRFFFNSAVVAVLSVVGSLIASSLAGYAFARLRFHGRDALFLIMLASLMVPPQVTLIPQFILFKSMNWYDTLYPLWVPYWAGSPFAIFLLRQYFMTMPRELEDAARIDGANFFRIYWGIFMPLAGPVLATIAVLVFLGSWNDFLMPIVYLSSTENYTIQVGLHFFNGGGDMSGTSGAAVDIIALMATSTLAMLPPLIVFMLAQRYFVRGVVLTGLKG